MTYRIVILGIILFICFSCKKTYNVTNEPKFKFVNGCKKQISSKVIDENGNGVSWTKLYDKRPDQTCEFTAFKRYEIIYKNGIIREIKFYVSGCDECEEHKCGNWKSFDEKGALIKTENFGACDETKFQ